MSRKSSQPTIIITFCATLVALSNILGCCGTMPAVQETAPPQAAKTPTPAPAPTVQLDTTLLPRSVLFGNSDKAAARISPDGTRISFLAPVNGVMNVWVGPADNPDTAAPVTSDTIRGIRNYFWAYTNDHILCARRQNQSCNRE